MRPALLSLSAATALFMSACGSPAAQDKSDLMDLPPALTTPVAAAQEAGLTPYWLGPTFEAGQRTFRVTWAELEDPEEDLAVRISYATPTGSGGQITFSVATYSAEAWETAKLRGALRVSSVTREGVTVLGWPAELFSIPAAEMLNRFLIIQAPGQVIVVPATATISADGRQINPLNDPDVLLAVLENLRPYPE